jgi:putative N6-adenine-specific DNA methylase
MQNLNLFLPCAAGVEDFLLAEAQRITGLGPDALTKQRGGVQVAGGWRDVLQLNLHCRLAQRVLVRLAYAPYRAEQDLYAIAAEVAWEAWFTPRQSIKVEITAQHSPLKSLNFAALTLKDAVCDRFRAKAGGVRPDVDTHHPDVRIYAHLNEQACWLYIDTSGEPLFKRGWREDTGDAPLKETLAAALVMASGWLDDAPALKPLYDPCCGSGTLLIEAAQMACGMPAGGLRRFAFERYLPFQPHVWNTITKEAADAINMGTKGTKPLIFGSDVAHRMVDFAQRNAERAGVAQRIEFRGGDALQRMPPAPVADFGGGVLLLNPPYGERISVAGSAGVGQRSRLSLPERAPQRALAPEPVPRFGAREIAFADDGGEFFTRLATHWKKNYAGWTAWMLTPDLKLPGKMRLRESRRVPFWNGPIECRLFRFDLVAGRPDGAGKAADAAPAALPSAPTPGAA